MPQGMIDSQVLMILMVMVSMAHLTRHPFCNKRCRYECSRHIVIRVGVKEWGRHTYGQKTVLNIRRVVGPKNSPVPKQKPARPFNILIHSGAILEDILSWLATLRLCRHHD